MAEFIKILDTSDMSLEELKLYRYHEIDNKTGKLISNGFIYNGLTFSLSYNAQINLLGLDASRNDPALTYPISYNTLDDSTTYNVVDATDVHNMYLTALATKKSILDSGTTLKDQIRAATSKSEVNAIIDNR